MSWTTIKADIDSVITANGSNAITGALLNPILKEICDLAEAENGDLSTLNTTDKSSLVNSINEVLSAITDPQISVLSGTIPPTVAPPPSFSTGDFFKLETGGGAFISWYQYDGNKWINLVDKLTNQQTSGIVVKSASYSITEFDKTIIYTGSNVADIITIGNPAGNINREVEVINQFASDINFSPTYIDYLGASVTAITGQQKTVVKSDGTNWYKI
jgi:hypothetical protein